MQTLKEEPRALGVLEKAADVLELDIDIGPEASTFPITCMYKHRSVFRFQAKSRLQPCWPAFRLSQTNKATSLSFNAGESLYPVAQSMT